MTAPSDADQKLTDALLPWTDRTVGQARGVLATWRAPRPSRRNYEAEMLAFGLGFLALLENGVENAPTDDCGLLLLPGADGSAGMALDRARSSISGWHFAKESLTGREQELLYIIEGLLRLLDERSPDGGLR